MQQFRNGLGIPVGVIGVGVAKPCGQLDHFPRRILAGPVPVDHRSRSEAEPQIVDAGTTPVAPLGLRFTQANALTHMCKVVARAAIAEPASIAFHKEWNRDRKSTRLTPVTNAHLV